MSDGLTDATWALTAPTVWERPDERSVPTLLAAIGQTLAARRESDAETIRELREELERLRADVEAWLDARKFWDRPEDIEVALRAILARHERPESGAVERCDSSCACLSDEPYERVRAARNPEAGEHR